MFWRCSTERQFGPGGCGPIPHSKIVEYLDRRGIDKQMAEVVIDVLMEMDDEYITWASKKRKAAAERDKPQETEEDG